jgi:hypothetical protein
MEVSLLSIGMDTKRGYLRRLSSKQIRRLPGGCLEAVYEDNIGRLPRKRRPPRKAT